MGTRKKLLLASLASIAMVLAFVLGAMPGFDATRLAAGSDQVAIQDILDALLGGGDKGASLTVNSAVQAVVVKTPAGAEYVVPEIPLPLTLSASVGNVPVRYVASEEGDNTVWSASANPNNPGGAGTWTGGAARTFTDPAVFSAPYASTLDIGTFVTGEASVRTLLIYGLANASLTAGEVATITYTSATPDPYAIDLREVDGDVTDVDGNGIPDDAFDNVGDAEIWTALVDDGEGNLRRVLVVNLDTVAKGTNQVFASPESGITVEAPSTADLIAANAIGAGESALLVVQVVDNLGELLDDEAVTGFASAAAWGEAAKAVVPVSAYNFAGPIVDVSILVNDGLGNLSELDSLPEALPVTITIEDLAEGDGEKLALFSTSTVLTEGNDGLVLGNPAGDIVWNLVTDELSTGTLSVDVTELSAFVPFVLPAVDITGASPNTALEGEQVALTLTGVIPVATGQSIAEAAAAYSVTVNGSPAEFRMGSGGFAIDAYVAGSTNAAYLYWTAAISTKATQQADIEISEIINGSPVLVDTLSNAIEITPTFDVVATAGPGGSVSIDTPSNGPNGSYVEGTSVAISATADDGFEFVAWTGLEAGETNAASTTITVNSDRAVQAIFQPIGIGGETFTLTVLRAGNGSGTVSPAAPVTVDEGTVVNLIATPASNSNFTGWTGDIATVADPAAPSTTVTVNANLTITANFTRKTADDDELTVSGIDAAGGLNEEGQVEVWLFGGETIRLNGTGLVAGADLVSFQVGSNPAVTADLFNTAPDGSFGLVVIPPTNATGTDAFFVANVTVTRASDNATFDLGNVVRYRQYDTGDDDVTTTAFILDNPSAPEPIQVSTGEGNTDFATLTLPGLNTSLSEVYGLVRTGVVDASKGNTEAVAGPVGTGQINSGLDAAFGNTIPGFDAAATQIPGSVDFAFYLYGGSDEAKSNTGTVGGAAFTPSNQLITFNRGSSGADGDLPTPGDPEGNAGDAGQFSVALADGVLTHGDVRDGLTVWGVETAYDYVTDTLELVENPDVDYQSTILNGEVSPVVVDAKQTADGTVVETVTMRLYTLNGFSLRQGVNASPEVTDGIRLNTQSGTASDDLAGGLPLTIVSPAGGLARIESARFVIGNATVGIVTEFTTAPGTDEYVLQFPAPASNQAGIASIVLTGRANNTAIQTVNLQNVFEYKSAAGDFPFELLLLLLGLLAAILGLAAGGSSGGGGGGPCFIATAAYGTPLDGNIDVLRDVRDEFLLTNAVGTAFTDMYYHVAPTVADSVAASPALAAVVRMLLVPVIFLGKMALISPALLALVSLSIGFFYFAMRKGARQS